MQALVCKEYGSPDGLVIEARADPTAGAEQIVIDVRAAGVNFPDILSIAGKYQDKFELPFVPGNEAAGVVSSVGATVSEFAVGDKVVIATRGNAFAEKCVCDVQSAFHLPDKLSFEQGAGFAVAYGTSYHALKQCADLQSDETVLVLGAAGGVGIAAVEIAKSFGARVIAAAGSAEKLEFARSAGADATINYNESALNQATKALTDGKGVDVVYDPVGGSLAQQALRATAWHGRYLIVGFASGVIPSLPANIALLKEASIVGVWWGTWAAKNPHVQRHNMAALQALVVQEKVLPRVTEIHDLQNFAAAFAALSERRARGKVILKIT